MKIPYSTYIKKLTACYLGKAIGGTLGMRYEGKTDTNNITYYNPVPEKMCGNDDLDLQIIWLETLLKTGFPVNRHHLSRAWKHLNFGPDEYCVALHNLRCGLFAPLSGAHCNKFCNGMGAAIRSELWAAIAAGNPDTAAILAREDACVDHCDGGLAGCVFLSAVESYAYIEKDTETLIEKGLSYVTYDARFSSAIRDTVSWWKQSGDLFGVRAKILEKYPHHNWSDVTINVCFVILAWLAGGGDFGKSICFAVNCGYDADCTAATLGALMGILYPEKIDKKWSAPIGRDLVLSHQILGIRTSKTIDGACEKIAALCKKCGDYYNPENAVCDYPENICAIAENIPVWTRDPAVVGWSDFHERESLLSLKPVTVKLIYPEGVALKKNVAATFTAIITNPSDIAADISLKLSAPETFRLSYTDFNFNLTPFGSVSFDFEIESLESYKAAFDELVFSFVINGMPYDVAAGLITAYPWVMTDRITDDLTGAVPYPADGIVNRIPSGAKTLAIEVCPAMKQQVAFTCQGTRPLKLWVNGKKVIDYNAKVYVPALHRGQASLFDLPSGWSRVVIQVEDGDAGEVFLAIGNPVDWIWLNSTEWREPEI